LKPFLTRVKIGVSVVAVVKTERLALTLVVVATKTVELIQKAYRDAALSQTSIFEWHKRFREGKESVKDETKTVVGPQQVEPMTTSPPSTKWSKKIKK